MKLVAMVSDPDFDRYCREHGIGPAEYGEAFARWLTERVEEPVRFEEVTPGEERILPPSADRELDALPPPLGRG